MFLTQLMFQPSYCTLKLDELRWIWCIWTFLCVMIVLRNLMHFSHHIVLLLFKSQDYVKNARLCCWYLFLSWHNLQEHANGNCTFVYQTTHAFINWIWQKKKETNHIRAHSFINSVHTRIPFHSSIQYIAKLLVQQSSWNFWTSSEQPA